MKIIYEICVIVYKNQLYWFRFQFILGIPWSMCRLRASENRVSSFVIFDNVFFRFFSFFFFIRILEFQCLDNLEESIQYAYALLFLNCWNFDLHISKNNYSYWRKSNLPPFLGVIQNSAPKVQNPDLTHKFRIQKYTPEPKIQWILYVGGQHKKIPAP